MKLAAMRSRLRNREVSTRKQVGDIASMINEEGAGEAAPDEIRQQL